MTIDDDKMSGMPEMPTLKAGEHKERLKVELMTVRGERGWAMPRWMRVAAMVAAGALLMGAGAATKEAFDAYRSTGWVKVDHEGNSMTSYPGATTEQEVEQQQKAIEDAIAAKKYRLLKEFDNIDSVHQYVYALTLADGKQMNVNGVVRLEDVSSWQQWQDREMEFLRQRTEQFRKAVKEGKARIVADEVTVFHVCKDVGTGKEVEVLKGRLPDGRVMANILPSPLGTSGAKETTSWQAHLDALAQGKRKLIRVEAAPMFTYEYPGPDGKMARYGIGGIASAEAEKGDASGEAATTNEAGAAQVR